MATQDGPTGITLPNDKELAQMLLAQQHASQSKQQEIGKIGVFFGSRDNAVIYLAWMIVVLAVIGCIVVVYLDPSERPDMAKALAALAIAALGYMAGKGSQSS